MSQRERDRLVVLKKARRKLITQVRAGGELGISVRRVRQVRRQLRALTAKGDKAVIHGLRGRASPRKVSPAKREQIVRILSQEETRGFKPTIASEYLRNRHGIEIGREALRQIRLGAGWWRARRQRVEKVHVWRPRRSWRGELVPWTPASTTSWKGVGRSCT